MRGKAVQIGSSERSPGRVTRLRLSAGGQRSPTSEEQFDALVREHYARIVAFVGQYLGSRESAEDIVQDVFAAIWSRREHLDYARPLPYLYRAARNRVVSVRRHDRVHAVHVAVVAAELRYAGLDERATVPATSPEATELSTAVSVAVRTLPERCRTVFLLSRDAGMTYPEIGQTLGISEKTVETHMSKALRSLRAALSPFLE